MSLMTWIGIIASLALAVGFCKMRKLPLTKIIIAWPAIFVILAVGYYVFLWVLRISFIFACIAVVVMAAVALASALNGNTKKPDANQ